MAGIGYQKSRQIYRLFFDSTPLARQSGRSYPAKPGAPYASAPFGGDPFPPGSFRESPFRRGTDDVPHLYLFSMELLAVYHIPGKVSIIFCPSM
jgi:hypothetical protein